MFPTSSSATRQMDQHAHHWPTIEDIKLTHEVSFDSRLLINPIIVLTFKTAAIALDFFNKATKDDRVPCTFNLNKIVHLTGNNINDAFQALETIYAEDGQPSVVEKLHCLLLEKYPASF